MPKFLPRTLSAWAFLMLFLPGLSMSRAVAGDASQYDFLAAPERDLNRIYRLDRTTGEVGACQYAMKEGTIGITLCYEPGQGAGPQPHSDYALVASSHEREASVFRVDERTGKMSICYVLNDKVVCTPPAR